MLNKIFSKDYFFYSFRFWAPWVFVMLVFIAGVYFLEPLAEYVCNSRIPPEQLFSIDTGCKEDVAVVILGCGIPFIAVLFALIAITGWNYLIWGKFYLLDTFVSLATGFIYVLATTTLVFTLAKTYSFGDPDPRTLQMATFVFGLLGAVVINLAYYFVRYVKLKK